MSRSTNLIAPLWGLRYSKNHGYKFTSLVITNVYGMRHQMKHAKFGVLNWFVRLALENKTIQIYGEGAQLREYLFIDDLVEAMCLARKGAKNTSRYIVGGPSSISVKNCAQTIINLAGLGRLEMVPWPMDRKQIESGDFTTDFSKIKQDLGWTPNTSFEEGIKRTIEFYKEFMSLYW